MQKLKAVAGIALCLTFAGIGSRVWADDSSFRPMIELGTGAETGVISGGTNVLLRVGIGFRKTNGKMLPGDVVTPEQLVVAHISGDLSVFNTDPNAPAVPYADIKFLPYSKVVSVLNESGNNMTGALQFLPGSLGRNINLDQSLSISVAVVGVQFEANKVVNEHASLFAQVAADLLGYKMASHFSDLSTFHGIHLVKVAAEGGLKYDFNDDFAIRVALGGSSDINWIGARFQSDMKAYASIKMDILRFMSVFVRGGFGGNWDSGNSFFQGSPEIMGGISVYF